MITNTLRSSVGSAVARIALAAFVLMLALSGAVAKPRAAEASHEFTLCTDINYGGTCRMYSSDIPSLGNTYFGNNKLSSLKVPSETRVVLYEHVDYTGKCQAFTADTWTLVGSYIGNDQASSLRFGSYSCDTPDATVTAYTDSGSYPLYSPIDKLGDTLVGNDTMTAIRVASGMTVALYSDISHEGTCQTLVGDGTIRSLDQYYIGKYKASSMLLNHSCDQDVQLCEHEHAGGRCVSFRGDKPNLTYTDIGNDTASSIRIPDDSGWRVYLWIDINYKGMSYDWTEEGWYNIGGFNPVPNDSASSIKVRPAP